VGLVNFRRLLRSRFAGLGNRAQMETCSRLPRIRRELRPELFCGKRWLLAIIEPIDKQRERLTHLRRDRSDQTVESSWWAAAATF
jgi:hypothetical protein